MLAPRTVWRRKDLLRLYVGPRSPQRQSDLPSVISIHSVPLTASAFPNGPTLTFRPWPHTTHQLPYATAETFSRILRMRLGGLLQDLPCGLGKSFVYLEMFWLLCFLHKLLSLWCFCPTAEHAGLSNQMRSKKIPAKTPPASVPPRQQPLQTADGIQTSTAWAWTMALPLCQHETNHHRKWE